MSKFEITITNETTGESRVLGSFNHLDDLSREFPVSINGTDSATMGLRQPEYWEVVIYQETSSGLRREVADPRVFLEELDLIMY